jgi:hypothetical protein
VVADALEVVAEALRPPEASAKAMRVLATTARQRRGSEVPLPVLAVSIRRWLISSLLFSSRHDHPA